MYYVLMYPEEGFFRCIGRVTLAAYNPNLVHFIYMIIEHQLWIQIQTGESFFKVGSLSLKAVIISIMIEPADLRFTNVYCSVYFTFKRIREYNVGNIVPLS